MEYLYQAAHNNGRIAQSIDHVLGETVNYSYDSLNRLVSAEEVSGKWANAFSYDGWGNINGQTWTPGQAAAPGTMSRGPSDANGNLTGWTGNNTQVYNYDVENRMVWEAQNASGGTINGVPVVNLGYDPWGKRVSQSGSGDSNGGSVSMYTFYGIDGKRLGRYQFLINDDGTYAFTPQGTNLYFGGTLIQSNGVAVATDRLGSVRANGSGEKFAYYPYGMERKLPPGNTITPDGREKFGTYTRDGESVVGQDYADQRYYDANSGSFWSPDPLGASAADPTDPNSWNMYAYAGGDPINFNDPDGTTACGDLNILGTGMTLSQAVTGGGDAALLSDLVWAESDHTWSRQGSQAYYNEQDAVAWAVENRWKILNGYLSVAGVSNPSTLGWGPNGASISQIIGWSGQFTTISGGQLRSDLQDTLNSVLAGSPTAGDVVTISSPGLAPVQMTHECYDVWQSEVAASFALNGTSSDPFASQGYTTSFHHGTLTTPLEGYFGNFGDANNFFGIAKGSVTANPTPVLPRPRPRPIRPPGKRPPGGRRGPL